ELLIVVAIILIIAAIAIPNLLRARIAANESSAASIVRTLNTAEVSYVTAYPATGYSADLASLGGAAIPCAPAVGTACLIDNTLATTGGTTGKSGYLFDAVGQGSGPFTGYIATGTPITVGSSGVNSFCSIEDAVVRKDISGALGTYAGCPGMPSLGN
ncbi:MAG TPA: pili assembly chaperone, partial [Terriglobales bacterium]|nr:pili assembly chaperone [Terriglobales bacterium]